ncbi:rRNA methyltransferase [Xanthomonadaceae bacterium JHOS43]|nr:rRNA methyltransferase [Xanthomonadaceae bacterium JHOS43]MCX7563404.1 rRNA methyltransferase [Xanthomonadaceae bacterium XH05]
MNGNGPIWPTLPRGERPDKRQRERERERGSKPGIPRSARGAGTPPAPETPPHQDAPRPRDPRRDELRVFGLNACLAAFAARPHDLRKAYLSASRMGALRELMAYCVAQRLGYRVVEDEDLARLTGSSHHEGVCLDMRRPPELAIDALIASLRPSGPACLLWLDGVGNPHNFGAVLRSAAHFGVAAVLLPEDSELALSGATCRVAEGGAEAVPLVRLGDPSQAIVALHAVGFQLAATVPRDGESVFATRLPERTVFVLGAEREGMQQGLIAQCDRRLTIPGSGKVESLNIASAVAVLLGVFASRIA